MNIIELNSRRNQAEAPLIAFVDLQMEYISEGRAFYIENTAGCLKNCHLLLSFARQMQLPIAHFRQITNSQFFSKATTFSNWIDEFQPRPSEIVFEREKHSCCDNASFRAVLDQVKAPIFILAGLSGSLSCLATAVDAASKKHKMIFVSDASASLPLNKYDYQESHDIVTEVVENFAYVLCTGQILAWLKQTRTAHTGAFV